MVFQGLSGTGKGTTVEALKKKLPRAITWSNGNVFRSLTLLALSYCEQKGIPFSQAALTPQVLQTLVGCLTFGKLNGEFDIQIHGFGAWARRGAARPLLPPLPPQPPPPNAARCPCPPTSCAGGRPVACSSVRPVAARSASARPGAANPGAEVAAAAESGGQARPYYRPLPNSQAIASGRGFRAGRRRLTGEPFGYRHPRP